MFVLGIPGGISAAVIFGALMIHGLQPGLRLFKNSPEIIYTIMWGFIAANVIMGFFAIFLARIMAYLTVIPRGLIAPLIMIFSVIGTYAGTNNIYDVWIMIGFGVIGYLMMKTNFSTAGLLLGLILGPIAEDGMRDLLIVSNNAPVSYILTRPISLVLVVSIAFIIYISFKPQPWQEK